ncbi:Uncharacterised protein [Vibrio cholerae]|nr:Uncharacterised protein [Vibrio cholerae]
MVVMLASKIVLKALSNPVSMACAKLRPSLSLSRIRSKISTLVSTAIPTVNTKPAIPGRVNTAPGNKAIRPNKQAMLTNKATFATQPKRRYQSAMKVSVIAIPSAKAAKPLAIFSSPKEAPMVRSSTMVTGAVSEPARNSRASCCASSIEPAPVIRNWLPN